MNIEILKQNAAADSKLYKITSSALFVFGGLALLLWAGLSDYFRHDEGTFPNGKFCLPFTGGLSLILYGCLRQCAWRAFAGWTALALFGQAISLQMIDAGRFTRFQQYRPLSVLLTDDLFLAILLLLQIIIVVFGIKAHLPNIRSWLLRTFSIWQIAAIAAILFFAGAALAKDISLYVTSLSIAAVVQLTNLANVFLIARSIPDQSAGWLKRKIDAFLGNAEKDKKPARLDRFAWAAALWVTIFAATLSYFVYRAHPHISDEAQYLYQARYMAAGQLTVHPPKVPEAFEVYMTPYKESRWFGIFPPGFPAVLAIGVALGAAWLINPVLGGVCVLLAYLFFWRMYSRRFARIGILLLCCSPWFVFMAMSFMSHTLTLACALAAVLLLLRAFDGSVLYAFASGLAVGLLSLVRPLDGLIVAFLLGIWTLLRCPTWKRKIFTGGALTLGTIASASIVFLYNKSVMGSAKVLPLVFYYDKYFWKNASAIGFGPDRGFLMGEDAFHGHTPLESVINTAVNTFSVNIELFGWSIGSLILAVCFALSGSLRKKDLWAIAAVAGVVSGFSLFWFNGGPDLGARYWFLVIIPLVALTVRGIEWLSENLNGSGKSASHLNPRLIIAVAALCLMSLVNYFPWRSFDKYYNYLEMRPDLPQLARQHNFGKSLVLIRGVYEQADYRSGWVYNPVNFEGDAPLYAWDKNPDLRRRLLEAYPERPVWIVEGPTLTGGAYRIVRGPLNACYLLDEIQAQSSKEKQDDRF